jgi:hypothetical protein
VAEAEAVFGPLSGSVCPVFDVIQGKGVTPDFSAERGGASAEFAGNAAETFTLFQTDASSSRSSGEAGMVYFPGVCQNDTKWY